MVRPWQPPAEAAALASALACLHAIHPASPLPQFPVVSAATVSRFIMSQEVRGEAYPYPRITRACGARLQVRLAESLCMVCRLE